MGVQISIQANFNGGEIGPLLYGRVDIDSYGSQCGRLLNMRPLEYGAVFKRAGTRFIAECKSHTTASALIPFEFSDTQAILIEMANGVFRFFKNRAPILSGGSPYEVAHSISASTFHRVHVIQSLDVLYLTEQSFAPFKLIRLADNNWSKTDIAFTPPPFEDMNGTATTLTCSNNSGNITVTASAATFAASDVGSIWAIEDLVASRYDLWESGHSVAIGEIKRFGSNVYRATNHGNTGTREPVHTEGTESDGTVSWQYLHSGQGWFQITAFTSATSVSATVLSWVPVTAATTRWRRPVWSATLGWPSTSALHKNRLFFAGRDRVTGSVVGDYENFAEKADKTTVTPDSAINELVQANKSSAIQWLADDLRGLLIGAQSNAWLMKPQGNEPMGPGTLSIDRASGYGSTHIQPVTADASIIYASRNGGKLQSFKYEFNIDGYSDANVGLFVPHLLNSPIKKIVYQQYPTPAIWVLLESGRLLCCSYYEGQQVRGWSEVQLGGYSNAAKTAAPVVEDIAILTTAAVEQEVYLTVRRYINGGTKRYIELLEQVYPFEQDLEDVFMVDCGLSYNGAPADVFSGLGHLEGETVGVLADGVQINDKVVTGGAVNIGRDASVVHIGYPYTATFRNLPPNTQSQQGPGFGQNQTVVWAALNLYNSLGGAYGLKGDVYEDMDPIPSLKGRPMDGAQPLFSGWVSFSMPATQRGTEPVIEVQHRDIAPFCIRNVTMAIEYQGPR